MIRCIGYIRVSRVDLVQENQAKAIRDWALKNSDTHVLIDLIEDDGRSGASDLATRPGWSEIQARIDKGLVDAVVIVALDRLSRLGAGAVLGAVEALRGQGVHLISLREQVNTSTALGEMMVALLASVARMERETMIARTEAGIARARAQGTRFGRPQRDISMRTVEALLKDGAGLASIARECRVSLPTLRRRMKDWGLLTERPVPRGLVGYKKGVKSPEATPAPVTENKP